MGFIELVLAIVVALVIFKAITDPVFGCRVGRYITSGADTGARRLRPPASRSRRL
jgi:hypothetical protein